MNEVMHTATDGRNRLLAPLLSRLLAIRGDLLISDTPWPLALPLRDTWSIIGNCIITSTQISTYIFYENRHLYICISDIYFDVKWLTVINYFTVARIQVRHQSECWQSPSGAIPQFTLPEVQVEVILFSVAIFL